MRTWFEIIDDIKTLVEELDEKYRAELFKDKVFNQDFNLKESGDESNITER